MSAAVTISGIAQISINARDLDRAAAFYRDALGLPFLFAAPKMAFFQCGAVRLMVALPEEPRYDHPSSIIYFKADDIEAAHAALSARGVRFLGPPHVVHRAPGLELWMAFFEDSEGNTLALTCEKRIA